ncbi:MAG: hypothetical protein PWQ97_273 [Tepidanaerobacteraceae bacterium]|nr:hypothetical protein [Tepidanaerobacteraceae bacterium]
MKRIVAILIAVALAIHPTFAWGAPADFNGGVNNEYRYEEVVFVTGEPITFSGTVKIDEREKGNIKTVRYQFDLKAEDLSEKTRLTRRITYVTEYDPITDKGQTIAATRLNGFRETIEIGKDKYELEDYQFSKSDVIDKRPASDFYSGNFKARKYYTINRDEGEVTIDISGGDVGYENFWGSTETQLIEFSISSKRNIPNEDDSTTTTEHTWNGTVNIQVSDSQVKTLSYEKSDVDLSSFIGGYIRTTNREMVSKYEYDLPVMKGNIPDNKKRNKDDISLSLKMVPKVERLMVPKFRDVQGHWAQTYIEKLYSLDVFDTGENFFVPDAPMTRENFIRGIIRACNIRTSEQNQKKTSSSRKKTPEVSPFKDVSPDDPNYEYIKEALSKGIITGAAKDLFKPKEPLTRAQAITILIRALGFAGKAPNPGYYTDFSDDDKIPSWAKDSIYVAREINLIEGDSYNRVNPDKAMTRAEASAMLVRFLEFLQKDLQKDYRENIIF